MADTIRVGFIGAGSNTRSRHLPGLKAMPNVELAWVCNRSMESGQRVADEFGIEKVTTDPDDIFNDPTVDAVCIGTWPYMHKDLSIRAIKAGKHVLCEARMAMDAPEAREMYAAARSNEGVSMLVPGPYDMRSGPTAKKLLAEGAIGQPTEIIIEVINGGGLNPDRTLQWRHNIEYSGYNTMIIGIYNEIMQRWLGDTTRVAAHAKVVVDKRINPDTGQEVDVKIPDSLTIAADMACGARATYIFSSVSPVLNKTAIRVFGTEGVLSWEGGQVGGDRLSIGKVGGELQTVEPAPGMAGDWRVEEDFIDSIRDGKPVTLVSFEDGVKYMEFTDSVWHSWNEGRTVDVRPVS